MRRELLYLKDIVEACDSIRDFLAEMDFSKFLASDLHQAAILQRLTVIGEAASRLPQEFRDAYPAVDWRGIVAFRNIAVHAYFAVQWDVVWATAVDDVPVLRRQAADILNLVNPATDGSGTVT